MTATAALLPVDLKSWSAALGRYVEVYIATPMHSLKLCTVLSGIPAPAAVMADAGAHSYSVWRNCMSESGALNRRKVVSGASSRASAFSFMARSAST